MSFEILTHIFKTYSFVHLTRILTVHQYNLCSRIFNLLKVTCNITQLCLFSEFLEVNAALFQVLE